MPRDSTSEPLVHLHIRIFKRDYEAMKRLSTNEAGINKIARTAIHSFVIHAEDEIRRQIDRIEGKPTNATSDTSAGAAPHPHQPEIRGAED